MFKSKPINILALMTCFTSPALAWLSKPELRLPTSILKMSPYDANQVENPMTICPLLPPPMDPSATAEFAMG